MRWKQRHPRRGSLYVTFGFVKTPCVETLSALALSSAPFAALPAAPALAATASFAKVAAASLAVPLA